MNHQGMQMRELLTVIAVLLASLVGATSNQPAPAHLHLTVFDRQGAVFGQAEVFIHGNPATDARKFRTRADGTFSVDLTEGSYAIVVQNAGFSPWCRELDLASGKSVDIRVILKISPFTKLIVD
jgi:hypothetical protein